MQHIIQIVGVSIVVHGALEVDSVANCEVGSVHCFDSFGEVDLGEVEAEVVRLKNFDYLLRQPLPFPL
jgi:hypothetical protein